MLPGGYYAKRMANRQTVLDDVLSAVDDPKSELATHYRLNQLNRLTGDLNLFPLGQITQRNGNIICGMMEFDNGRGGSSTSTTSTYLSARQRTHTLAHAPSRCSTHSTMYSIRYQRPRVQ